jgi:CSLREA domain-containing protein
MLRFATRLLLCLVVTLTATAATHTVNSTADTSDGVCDASSCTLREAILAANAAGGGTIEFATGSGPITITLATALPDLVTPIVIDGTTQPGYAGSPIVQINGMSASACLVVRSGGTTIRGLDIGNCLDGISVLADNAAVASVAIERNYIGTRLTLAPINRRAISLATAGTGTLSGVTIGNATPAGRNVLATWGFVEDALYIAGSTTNVTVAGNFFGVADDGTPLLTAARFTTDIGIYGAPGSGNFTIGGSAAGARNVFGSGGGTQINLKIDSQHTDLVVEGNYIGTDPAGMVARRATNFAVWFFGQGEGVIRNNIITSGNTAISRGVATTGAVTVQGNWLNVRADGTAFASVAAAGINDFSSAPGYTIGGPNPGDGNVIANYSTAISVSAPGALVQGNYVGLNPAGTAILGSGARGIQSSFARTEPGVFIRDNRVAGFTTGIDIGSEALVTVDGNYVGTDAAGTAARPNTTGIQISNAAGRAIVTNNLISGNTSHGVLIQTGTMPVTMTGNRIGVSATGTPLPNGGDGVRVASGTALKSIGTALGTPNTIAYNLGNGIGIAGGTSTAIIRNSIFANTGLAIDLNVDGATTNDTVDADTGPNALQNAPVLTSAITAGATTTILGTLHSTPNSSFVIELYANVAGDPLGAGEAETFLSRFIVSTDAGGNVPFTANMAAVSPGLVISATATNSSTNDTSEMSNNVTASAGIVQFSAATASVNESAASITLTVTRTDGLGSTTLVEYTSANGTATSGSDYTAVSGTLTFGPSDSSATIVIPIQPDALNEAAETFTVTLGNVAGGNLGSPATITVTVTDDDPAPSLSVSDPSVVETNSGTTMLTFDVTLSAVSGQQVTVDYTTADATASSGSDYGARFGTLTFAPGETARAVAITVNGDVTAEADETLQLLLSSPVNASIGDGSGTGTITNDDGAPSISTGDATVIEGSGGSSNAAVVVTLSNPSSFTVTADWMTSGNTASSGSDFTASSGTVTFAPGTTTQTIAVPVLGDTIVEGNESFFLDLTNPSNATIADAQAAVTIVDDDGSPALTISDLAVNESTGTASVTVLLAPASAQTVTVDWSTVAGTATAGSDFTAANGTLTFTPSQTARTIDIAIADDGVTEPAEAFSISLQSPANAAIADGDATVTIIDDDPVPTISVADVTVAEGGTASLNVTLSNASAAAVTVNYLTVSGAAGAADFSSVSGTLTFAPGEVSKVVNVLTTADTLQEPDELFFFDLSSAANATITRPRATVTITDDDGTPALLIGDATVTEGDAGTVTASFTVTLAGNAAQTVTVDYATADGTATAGADYASSSGNLIFSPGTTTRTIQVPVVGDLNVEAGETFFVNLSNATNATISDNQALGTIDNDDVAAVVPSISIGDANVAEGDAGTTALTFNVTLSAPTTTTVTVGYATANDTATAGSDYASSSGTLVFAPGVTSQSIVVAVAGDVTVEGNETLFVNLSGATNGTLLDTQASGTILDDDVAAVVPSISIGDANVAEGDAGTTALTFNVTLSAPTTNTVTVGYATANDTATAGSDYASSSGTLVFAPGVTSQSIVVAVAGDVAVEGNETLFVNLSGATNGTLLDAQATGTIVDDDVAAVLPAISIGNAKVDEGDSGSRSLTFSVKLSEATSNMVTASYATANGSATAGSDYAAASGTIVFPAGTTSRTITIAVAGDTLIEPDETFTVVLSNPSGAVLGDANGRGTIVNDDQVTTPSIAVDDIEVSESADVATFIVTLSAPAAEPVVVTYATSDESAVAGSDYLATNGTLTFAAGETSHHVDVPLINDAVIEGGETFLLTLSNGTEATAVIHDDDSGVAAVLVIGGSGPGSLGSFFRTVLQLHNASDAPSTGNLIVRPMGGGEPRTFGYALAPRETRDLAATIDVTGFVTADLVALTGAVPRTSVRVFNDAGEHGRTGFTATLVPVSRAITTGKRAIVIAPDDAASTRFNIGMRALGNGASLELTLRRADGNVAARVSRELDANVLVQIAAPQLFGAAIEDNDVVDIAVTRGAALVYGSSVDNVTQDPSFAIAEPLP